MQNTLYIIYISDINYLPKLWSNDANYIAGPLIVFFYPLAFREEK